MSKIPRGWIKLQLQVTYRQKLAKLFSATCVTLKSGCDSSSSSRIILTTTTWIRLPIAGSLYKDDTMFMIVSRYVSTSPSWWNATIEGSATINASTCRGLLTDRLGLERLLLLWCPWPRVFLPPWTRTYTGFFLAVNIHFPIRAKVSTSPCVCHSMRVSVKRRGSLVPHVLIMCFFLFLRLRRLRLWCVPWCWFYLIDKNWINMFKLLFY